MGVVVIQSIGLLLAGLLAGEEFAVCHGVQPALTALDDNAHMKARQALVRRLRVCREGTAGRTPTSAIVPAHRDWKSVIRRREQIDVFRSSAAMLAFACYLVAVVLQLPER
jgi:hypothetical protein